MTNEPINNTPRSDAPLIPDVNILSASSDPDPQTLSERDVCATLLAASFGVLFENGQRQLVTESAKTERQTPPGHTAATSPAPVAQRLSLEAALNAETDLRLRSDHTIPHQPEHLANFASRLVDLLDNQPHAFSDLFGQSVDTAKLAMLLRPTVEALQSALSNPGSARLDHFSRAAACLIEAIFLLSHHEDAPQRAAAILNTAL